MEVVRGWGDTDMSRGVAGYSYGHGLSVYCGLGLISFSEFPEFAVLWCGPVLGVLCVERFREVYLYPIHYVVSLLFRCE